MKYVSLCRKAGAHVFPLYHSGQCKSTGGYLQRPGVGFFFTPELDKTQYQQSLCLSEHNSTLFVVTHDTRTIGKIAVYDMAINLLFIAWFIRKSRTSLKQEAVFC